MAECIIMVMRNSPAASSTIIIAAPLVQYPVLVPPSALIPLSDGSVGVMQAWGWVFVSEPGDWPSSMTECLIARGFTFPIGVMDLGAARLAVGIRQAIRCKGPGQEWNGLDGPSSGCGCVAGYESAATVSWYYFIILLLLCLVFYLISSLLIFYHDDEAYLNDNISRRGVQCYPCLNGTVRARQSPILSCVACDRRLNEVAPSMGMWACICPPGYERSAVDDVCVQTQHTTGPDPFWTVQLFVILTGVAVGCALLAFALMAAVLLF
jgi:hypothetical protein